MKILSVLAVLIGLGVSHGALAQGVGGSGGTERDVVEAPVKLAAYAGGRSFGYLRFPYYPSQVTCSYFQAYLEHYRELLVYTKPHLYGVYGTRNAFCGDTSSSNNIVPVRVNVQTKDGPCPVYKCSIVYSD